MGSEFTVSEFNAEKYAINSTTIPTSTPVIIPLTLNIKTDGLYIIDITEFENLESFDIVLKHGLKETTLIKNSSYSFNSQAGTYKDFQLIISNAATLVEALISDKIKLWYSNIALYIECPTEISTDKGNLIICNINGKMVYNDLLLMTRGQTTSLPLNISPGLYIIQIIVNNQRFVSKIVKY